MTIVDLFNWQVNFEKAIFDFEQLLYALFLYHNFFFDIQIYLTKI
jgi:hypothetical protein